MPGPLTGVHLQGAIVGYPIYLGTVDATTTSKTNKEATTPFNDTTPGLSGKVLLIYNAGSVDIRVYPVDTDTGVVTNTRAAGAKFGVPLAPGSFFTIRMGATYRWMAVITTSSTANVDFWEMM